MQRKATIRPIDAETEGIALYKAVKNDLLRRIIDGNMRPHEKLPSEGTIALEYDVSKMVSKMALNALEEEGYLYRKPRSGSYVADRDAAQSAAMAAKAKFVCIIVPMFDPYCADIVAGLGRHFKELGCNIALRITNGSFAQEEAALNELAALDSVAGIVLFPTSRRFCGDQLLHMQLDRYPIVLIDTIFRELSLDSVSHDHYKGAFDMTNHLLDMGHEKICFLSSTIAEMYSRQERVRGFQDAILARDMVFDKKMVRELSFLETPTDYSLFLDQLQDTSCVFCGNDYIAKEVYTHAQSRGIKVPEDLSLAGYTDNALLSFMSIGLTTVRQPVNRFCAEVSQLLQRRIQDPSKQIESILIETEVVRRDSVRKIETPPPPHDFLTFKPLKLPRSLKSTFPRHSCRSP